MARRRYRDRIRYEPRRKVRLLRHSRSTQALPELGQPLFGDGRIGSHERLGGELGIHREDGLDEGKGLCLASLRFVDRDQRPAAGGQVGVGRPVTRKRRDKTGETRPYSNGENRWTGQVAQIKWAKWVPESASMRMLARSCVKAPAAGSQCLDQLLRRESTQVYVGRRQVCMAKLRLDLVDRHTFAGQLRSMGMTQPVDSS